MLTTYLFVAVLQHIGDLRLRQSKYAHTPTPSMTVLATIAEHWPVTILVLLHIHLISNYFYNGLQRYPSAHPLAGFTDWWRYLDVLSRKAEKTHIAAHRKHGDIIRLGPGVLSFADPKAIRSIYGLNKGMTKSDFYPVQSAIANGRPLQSLFSTQDEAYHARYRRCVNGAFSTTNLKGYEPLVDSTVDIFLKKTKERYADTGKACDFSQWLQFFAFDVIGELTWSKRLGFVETGQDIGGIIKFVSDFLTYAAPIGQMPWMDMIFWQNPVKLKLQQLGFSKSVFPVTKFALERSAERLESEGDDLLAKFLQAQKEHPDVMTDKQVLATCNSMINAGSETTAISLSSIFYHLLKHPRVYKKLMEELDTAAITDRHNKSVSWTESQDLRYLDAVIQESFRIHPAPGLILERVVPPGGVDICGEYIKGGTIVGCNPFVVHRREEVFGGDVDVFRPERWLEAGEDQLREMRAAMFMFGAGSRTCIGKNISLLEIYKLVPTLLRNFDIEFARPGLEWKTHNAWFVTQREFEVKFKERESA